MKTGNKVALGIGLGALALYLIPRVLLVNADIFRREDKLTPEQQKRVDEAIDGRGLGPLPREFPGPDGRMIPVVGAGNTRGRYS